MKKLMIGALIGLTGLASHANGAQMNSADRDLLSTISQAQYQALLYAVTECGFEPSTQLAVALLKSPALAPITAALAKHDEPAPVLDRAACAALARK